MHLFASKCKCIDLSGRIRSGHAIANHLPGYLLRNKSKMKRFITPVFHCDFQKYLIIAVRDTCYASN